MSWSDCHMTHCHTADTDNEAPCYCFLHKINVNCSLDKVSSYATKFYFPKKPSESKAVDTRTEIEILAEILAIAQHQYSEPYKNLVDYTVHRNSAQKECQDGIMKTQIELREQVRAWKQKNLSKLDQIKLDQLTQNSPDKHPYHEFQSQLFDTPSTPADHPPPSGSAPAPDTQVSVNFHSDSSCYHQLPSFYLFYSDVNCSDFSTSNAVSLLTTADSACSHFVISYGLFQKLNISENKINRSHHFQLRKQLKKGKCPSVRLSVSTSFKANKSIK